jgi:F-type H+-transporting ATPase subunit gamma
LSGTTDGLARSMAGARDLKAVVRAMKALAASSIGQYENAVGALEDYFRTLELALAAYFGGASVKTLPPARKAVGVVIFGSDQGLVGRFNEILLDFYLSTPLPTKPVRVWVIGERMSSLTADARVSSERSILVPTSVNAISGLIGQLLLEIEAALESAGIGAIYLFHNQLRTGSLYAPRVQRLLPLDAEWQRHFATLTWPTCQVPQLIEGNSSILENLVREYLFIVLFRACAESLASENASRLAAMQRADRNIDQILEDLNRRYHRDRQASIDEDLFEVVSAYESLKVR